MIKLHTWLSFSDRFSPEQRRNIDADRIDLLYKHSPMSILGSSVSATVLTHLLRNQVSFPSLMIWFSATMAIMFLRAMVVFRYYRHHAAPERMRIWGWWHVLTLGLPGIAWGAASVMIFPLHSVPYQLFLALIVCGLVAGAAMAFAVMLRAFLIFSVPAVFALAIRMLTVGSELHVFVGILAIFFWVLSLLIALNIRQTRLQLLFLKEELADRVVRRTTDLESANTRLRDEIQQRMDAQQESQRMHARLETASKLEAIATLAGGVAHQFNNALAVIVGALELIREDTMYSGENGKYINLISQSANQMSALTNQLLAYARGGKYKSKPAPVHDFIDSTLAFIRHSVSPAITIHLQIEAGLPEIEIDDTQMKMAFSAIVANACEAMPAGGRLTIGARAVWLGKDDMDREGAIVPGRYVHFTFKDTGVGMSQEALDRIFEPFFSTKFQGRGLAMAAVYGIIKSHQGHVKVTSQKGSGTIVDFFLPAVVSMAPQTSTIYQPPEPIQGNATVLLIEDEAPVMAINKAMLNHIGYDVIGAETGQAAKALISDPSVVFDLIMLDIKLPDMDGTALLPEIRDHRPHVGVVVCSGFALDAATWTLKKDGVHGFIQKPFSLHELAELLDRVSYDTQPAPS